MSDLHVDPERLIAAAEELSKFSTDVGRELEQLTRELDRIGQTWQDEEYSKFKTAMQPLRTTLERFQESILKDKPKMLADAEYIRAYQQHQAP